MSSGLAGRYATALFELARERDGVPALEADIGRLEEALATGPELMRTLKSPVVSRDEHAGTVEALAKDLELSELTTHFLGVLAEKRRLGVLPEIMRVLHLLLAEERGETVAEVVSAVPLSEAQLGDVKQSIAAYVDQAVRLVASVDPGLIGGLVVRVGSRMIDASLKTKLQQLELSMRGLR